MIILSIDDSKYPSRLRNIAKPPETLYVEGNLNLLNENGIAIIGSRSCSENGKKYAQKFAEDLSMQNLVIISGMARGIDTAAHKGSLNINGKTIAVLGNGFKNIFPQSNIPLYKKIIEKGGTIVSEYPPDVKADSSKFLERNRIVSGLSIGILVIEAAYRSGTSVTARIAKEQKKKIFAIPHEIENIHGVGTNRLIHEGATLVTSVEDIIEKFDFLKYKEIDQTQNINCKRNNGNKKINLKKYNKVIFESNKVDYEKQKNEQINYSIFDCIESENNEFENDKFDNKEQQTIYEIIATKELTIDEICQETNMPISKINENLLLLELKGYINKNNTGKYQSS